MSPYVFLFFVAVAGSGYLVVKGYNSMRRCAEEVKEGFSNISVVTRKKTALINQLITVVQGYAESEKLVMLKLSEDSMQAVQNTNVSSGLVLTEIGRMAQRFPDLKSNQQYNRLMDSINICERDVENSRLSYNERARKYNTFCSSLPAVLYAKTVGFGPAAYLSMQAQEVEDAGIQKPMIQEDSQRLNEILGAAGRKALKVAHDAHAQGKEWIENSSLRLAESTAAETVEPAASVERGTKNDNSDHQGDIP